MSEPAKEKRRRAARTAFGDLARVCWDVAVGRESPSTPPSTPPDPPSERPKGDGRK